MTSICCKRETSQRTEGAITILTDVNLNTGLRDRANTLRIGYGQIWLQTDCRKRKIHGSKNRRGNFSLTKACGIFLPAAGKTRSESWYRSLRHTFSTLRDNNSLGVIQLCVKTEEEAAGSERAAIRLQRKISELRHLKHGEQNSNQHTEWKTLENGMPSVFGCKTTKGKVSDGN